MARRRKRNYTVRTGDTAATIAKQLGIDPQTLMRANTGVGNLRPGMVLAAPSPYTYSNADFAYKGGKVLYSQRPDIAGGETPYPPSPSTIDFTKNYFPQVTVPPPGDTRGPFAERPIPAYTVPAGTGEPTDYTHAYWDFASIEQQTAAGVTDTRMIEMGYAKSGDGWMRAKPGGPVSDATAGALTWGEVAELKGRGSSTETVKSSHEGTYAAKVRYDAYGNLRTFAPVAKTRGTIGHVQPTKGQRQRYGDAVGTKRWKKRKKEEPAKPSGEAVGRAAGYYPQQSAAGRMPSTRQYARPRYLGLINWRI